MLCAMNSTDQLAARTPASHVGWISTAEPIRDPDPESQAWIDGLSADGSEHRRAVGALHALLLKAARFEVHRRRASVCGLEDEAADVARQVADDALVIVLEKVGDFRGDSRFTTWASKFALVETAKKLRRLAWLTRAIPFTLDSWSLTADGGSTRRQDLDTAELLAGLKEAIHSDLSPYQREALVAVAVHDVPIDVLAQRLGTTRGALYKTIRDARCRLRKTLEARGLSVGESVGAQRA